MLNRLKHHLRRRLTALIASGAAAALAAERHQHELAAKWSPALKAAQHGLFHHYRAMARAGAVPSIDDVGYRVFSQFDEDGLFVFLLRAQRPGGGLDTGDQRRTHPAPSTQSGTFPALRGGQGHALR